MPTIPPEFYGPAGLLVFLIVAVWRLWRLHEEEDDRRDKALDSLVAQLPELIASNKNLAGTIADRLSEADSQKSETRSTMDTRRRPVPSRERKDGA